MGLLSSSVRSCSLFYNHIRTRINSNQIYLIRVNLPTIVWPVKMAGVPVLLEVDSQVHVVGRIAFCHVSVSFLNWVKIFLWMSIQGFSLPNQTGNCNWLPPWQNLQNYDSHLKSKFGSSEGYPIAPLVYGLNWFVVWTRHNFSNILPLTLDFCPSIDQLCHSRCVATI